MKMTKTEIELEVRMYAGKAYKVADLANSQAKDRINTAVRQIVFYAFAMPRMGADFKFGSNKKISDAIVSMQKDIKAIVVEKSNAVKNISNTLNRRFNLTPVDWDNEGWIDSLQYEKSYDTRLSDYVGRLKREIEIFVALGLTKNLSQQATVDWFMSNINSPHTNFEVLNATNYASVAASKLLKVGRGGITSAWQSIVRLNEDVVVSSYHISNRMTWSVLSGKYVVTMGDSLVCKKCEANVGMTFKPDEWVTPVHNRCRCLEVPILTE